MDDLRLEWIKEIVCTHLDVSETEAFDDLFERDIDCAKTLYSFLAGSKEKRLAFFYDTETEVEVEIEAPAQEEEEEESQENEEVADEISEGQEQAPTTAGESISITVTDEAEIPEGESVEDAEPAEEEDQEELIEQKKFMKQLVKKTCINICFNITEHIPGQRYVYFLLRKFEPVPFIETWEETAETMPNYFEVGVINKHPLINMLDILTLVYLPLLKEENSVLVADEDAQKLHGNEVELARAQFIRGVEEFSESASIIVEQIKKPFLFTLPENLPYSSPEELSNDSAFVLEAEGLLKEWTVTLRNYVREISLKKPQEKSPFSEIQFWAQCRADLSAVSDHLSNPTLNTILKTLQVSGCSGLKKFEDECGKMKKQLYIIKDNLSYLTNLEPYLKDMHYDSPMQSAIQAVSPLLNIYKLLWTLSGYYGRPENMGRLIEGLGLVIENKIESAGNVKILLRKPFSVIQETLEACKALAKEWKTAYRNQQAQIEALEGLQHWYFSAKTLFEKTDYMCIICDNLSDICKKWEHQQSLLKKELKMFMKDDTEYELLATLIDDLPVRIKHVDFNIFEPKNNLLWTNLMQWFDRQCVVIENKAKELFNRILKEESNFEIAIHLIESYSKSNISPSVQELIQEKYKEILNRYCNEVMQVKQQFQKGKDDPPKYKGYATLTSAIIWERHLLNKIKPPMLIFRKDKNFSTSETGQKVQECYLKVAKELRKYENEIFSKWKETTSRNIPLLLQTSLLEKDCLNPYFCSITDTVDQQRLTHTILSEMNYRNNFPPDLQEIMINAGFLEHVGFKMPPAISNFISKEEAYTAYVKTLDTALYKLHNILGSLNYAEVKLLEKKLSELNSVVELGIKHLQWASLGISEFVADMQKATDCFGSVVLQVKRIGEEIDNKINCLKKIQLLHFKNPPEKCTQMCQVFFEEAEKLMILNMEDHVKTYRSILPLLYKIESLTCHSSTGCAEPMREYYRQCEIKILNALTEMVNENLDLLSWSLESHIFPYFSAVFSSTDPLVKASTENAHLIFQTYLISCVRSTEMFKRWMDGTCLEAPHQFMEEEEDTFEYTYYSDVTLHAEIRKQTLGINTRVKHYIEKLQIKVLKNVPT